MIHTGREGVHVDQQIENQSFSLCDFPFQPVSNLTSIPW